MAFPPPMLIGRSLLWDESEIAAWEKALPRRLFGGEHEDTAA
jgi:predicted DNA-binding transcriptional regulator AlpA